MSRALCAVLVWFVACSSSESQRTVSLDTSFSAAPRAEPWPLEGGTLAVDHNGRWALAAQPDRGTVAVVDLAAPKVIGELPFGLNHRPGRVAQAPDNVFWIVLNGAGAVATYDADTKVAHLIEGVCASPHGIAFEAGSAYVSCTDGTLAKLDGTHVLARWSVAPDARDVVSWNHKLWVSRFKTAQMVEVTLDGNPVQTLTPTSTASVDGRTFSPTVGWRAVWSPGGPLMVHQESQMTAINVGRMPQGSTDPTMTMTGGAGTCTPSVYNGGSCNIGSFCQRPVVSSVLSQLSGNGSGGTQFVGGAVPVDVAYDPSSNTVAVAAAGSHAVMTSFLSNNGSDVCDPGFTMTALAARPVAVAFTPGGLTVVQTKSPASLMVLHGGPTIALPAEAQSAGFDMFHTEASPRGIACASCHPAGLEDGHTWQFVPQGARRTQSLAGGIASSAPFHWDGAFNDMPTLLQEVMVNRMGGQPVPADVEQSLMAWLDSVPAPVAKRGGTDPSVARGRDLFNRPDIGCAGCHTSPRPTVSFDVGTGRTVRQAFQVPDLTGVSSRLPLMHDGCAVTMEQRFDPACGGAEHGNTQGLTAQEKADLIAYLESL